MAIKVGLFDVGRVIVGFNTSRIGQHLSRFSPYTSYHINDAIFRVSKTGERLELLKQFEEGKITAAYFYHQIKKLTATNDDLTYEHFREIWPDIFYENPGMDELISELSKSGIRLIVLSTTDEIMRNWLETHIPVIRNHFSDPANNVLSFQIGVSKPDQRIWQIALERAQCKPSELFFVDDYAPLLHSFEQYCQQNFNEPPYIVHYNCEREPIDVLRSKLNKLGILSKAAQ